MDSVNSNWAASPRDLYGEKTHHILAGEHSVTAIGPKIAEGGERVVHLATTIFANSLQKGVIKLPKEHAVSSHETEIMLQLKGKPGIIDFHTITHGSQVAIIEVQAGRHTPEGEVTTVADYDRIITQFTDGDYSAILGHFVEVIDGLIAMRDAGIVYRDLKPENILVLSDGRFAISDFGYATQDPSQDIKGTTLFMAPEMAVAQASEKSDVWAFGMTFMQFLGTPPAHEHPIFRGAFNDGEEEAARRVLSDYNNPALSEKMADEFAANYPEPEEGTFAHLIWRCTQLDPARRPNLDELKALYIQAIS